MDKITKLENMMTNFNTTKPIPKSIPKQEVIEKSVSKQEVPKKIISKPINIPKPVPKGVNLSTIRLKNFWE